MPTRYPDLFVALAAPFEPAELKQRPQGRQQLTYVTARTVMNRLDTVLGPECWWTVLERAGEHAWLCRLTIALPDGQTVTKMDVGGCAGMADDGDDEKSGTSDALKRAAVQFGVGRYLYRDGVPSYGPAATTAPAAPPKLAAGTNGNGHASTSANGSSQGKPRTEWPGKGPGSAGVSAGALAAIAAAKAEMSPPLAGERAATAKQCDVIRDLARSRHVTESQLLAGIRRDYHCEGPAHLERKQAAELIQRLRDLKPSAVLPEAN